MIRPIEHINVYPDPDGSVGLRIGAFTGDLA